MQQSLRKGMSMLAAVAASFLQVSPAFANDGNGPSGKPGRVTSVSLANPKVVGVSAPNILSPELNETIAAQGSSKTSVEKPVLHFPTPNSPTALSIAFFPITPLI